MADWLRKRSGTRSRAIRHSAFDAPVNEAIPARRVDLLAGMVHDESGIAHVDSRSDGDRRVIDFEMAAPSELHHVTT